MELLGLLFAAPVTFVASIVYVVLIFAIFKFLPVAGRVLVAGSLGVVAVVTLEFVLLAMKGAKGTYAQLGHLFTAMHFLGLLLGPPAVANLAFYIVSRLNPRQWLRFSCTTFCCWVACMSALLGHIAVDEAIVGIDAGRPFYMKPPHAPNKAAAVNAPIVPRFHFGYPWRRVTDQRR